MLIRFRITITYIKSALKNRKTDTTQTPQRALHKGGPTRILTYLYTHFDRPAELKGQASFNYQNTTTIISDTNPRSTAEYENTKFCLLHHPTTTVPRPPDTITRRNYHQKSPWNSFLSLLHFSCYFMNTFVETKICVCFSSSPYA